MGHHVLYFPGGWTGKVPGDNPNVADKIQADATGTTLKAQLSTTNLQRAEANSVTSPPLTATPAPEYASRAGTPADHSPSQPPNYFSPTLPTAEARRNAEVDDMRDRSHSINSITSLGSFPSPPTHFPIPPVLGSQVSSTAPPVTPDEQGTRRRKESMDTSSGPASRTSDVNNATFLDFNSPPTSPSIVGDLERSPPRFLLATSGQREQEPRVSVSSGSQSERAPSSPVASSSTSSAMRSSPIYKRGDYIDDSEFGVRKALKSDLAERESQRSPSPRTNVVERRDTNRSSGSVVSMARGFARAVSVYAIALFLRLTM